MTHTALVRSSTIGKGIVSVAASPAAAARRRRGSPGRGGPRVEGLEGRTLFALTVAPYDPSTPTIELAQRLLLPNTGIFLNGATFVGEPGQAGSYGGFNFQSGPTQLSIADGVLLTSGSAAAAAPPAANPTNNPNTNRPDQPAGGDDETTSHLTPGDPQLDALVGDPTQDANSLSIDFAVAPGVQSVLFDFIFGSEEFPEFVGAGVNDAFAAYLDGVQISFDTNNQPITVNNNFFRLNNSGLTAAQDPDVGGTTPVDFAIEYDGLTPTIRTSAPLNAGLATHTLRFVIADTGDSILDSGVFISRLQGSTSAVPGPTTELPQPGRFTFSPATYALSEDGIAATVTVIREGGASGLVTVDIATVDGTATAAGNDFVPLFSPTTLTFADQQTSQTVTVFVNEDALAEGDEIFFLDLSNPTNAATLGASPRAEVRIVDNELGVEFLQPVFTLQEGADTIDATITVTLTGPGPLPVTVNYATTPGTATENVDFTPVSGTLTFAPGVTTQTFTVPILDDFVVEQDESFTVTLSNPTGGFNLAFINPATVTITDRVRPPTVLDAQFVTNGRVTDGVALRYSEAMDEEFTEDLRNYDLFTRKESRKLNGPPTRTRVTLTSAVYEAGSRTVTLTTDRPLKDNLMYEVVVRTRSDETGIEVDPVTGEVDEVPQEEGVKSAEGEPLDGNYDDVAGDDFIGYLTRTTRSTFFDRDGDTVNLRLVGPGRMEIFRNVARDIRQVRLISTSLDAVLTGSVKRNLNFSAGTSPIRTLLTGTGARVQLPQPPFIVRETIAALSKPNT